MKTESIILQPVRSIGTHPLKGFAIDIEKAETFLIKNCQPGPPSGKVTTPPNGICRV